MERNLVWKSISRRNYAQKRPSNDFRFWYFKNFSKRDLRTSTIFVFQKYIKISTSKLHQFSINIVSKKVTHRNYIKKICQNYMKICRYFLSNVSTYYRHRIDVNLTKCVRWESLSNRVRNSLSDLMYQSTLLRNHALVSWNDVLRWLSVYLEIAICS